MATLLEKAANFLQSRNQRSLRHGADMTASDGGGEHKNLAEGRVGGDDFKDMKYCPGGGCDTK
jgi:hypothetical protein